jgi:UDP-N-acetyl-2-amino-2-deoxyglucuronate dehydrogenase
MLHFIFGDVQANVVHLSTGTRAGGYLEYERARVRWFLSVDVADVPETQRNAGQRTYRAVTIDGEAVEFSDGFTELHQRTYEEILAGRGFGLSENRCAIATVAAIRAAVPIGPQGDYHPLVRGQA